MGTGWENLLHWSLGDSIDRSIECLRASPLLTQTIDKQTTLWAVFYQVYEVLKTSTDCLFFSGLFYSHGHYCSSPAWGHACQSWNFTELSLTKVSWEHLLHSTVLKPCDMKTKISIWWYHENKWVSWGL